MRALNTLTPRQSEAYAHHRAGLAPAQIAERMSLSYSRARGVLLTIGVKPHRQKAPPGQGTSRPAPQHTREEVAQRRTQRRAHLRTILSSHPNITAREARDHLPPALRAAVETISADIRAIRKELTP